MLILYAIFLFSYFDILDFYVDIYSIKTFTNLNTFEMLRSLDFSLFYLISCLIFSKFGFIATAILASLFQIIYGILTIFILEVNSDEVSPILIYLLALFNDGAWIMIMINLLLGCDKILRKSGLFLYCICYCFLSLARVIYSYKREDIIDWYLGIFDTDSSKQLFVLSLVSLVSVIVAFPVQQYLVRVN